MRPSAVLCFFIALSVTLGPVDAQSQLRQPKAEPFFVEGWHGWVIPMNELQNEGCAATALGGCETSFNARPEIGFKIGGRVWKPLNLDAGLRFGYGVQKGFTLAERSDSYQTGIDMIELLPFVRAGIFPFKKDTWGIGMEFGAGMFFAFGGKDGANPFPEDSQMLVRLRVSFGAIWRWSNRVSLNFDAISLVTDIPITDFWSREVGTQLGFEPNAGIQYRF